MFKVNRKDIIGSFEPFWVSFDFERVGYLLLWKSILTTTLILFVPVFHEVSIIFETTWIETPNGFHSCHCCFIIKQMSYIFVFGTSSEQSNNIFSRTYRTSHCNWNNFTLLRLHVALSHIILCRTYHQSLWTWSIQKQPLEVFREIAGVKNLAIFTGKHLFWSLFLI